MTNTPLWGSLVPAAIRENFRRNKAAAEGTRMLQASNRLGMLDDDWKDLLVAKLWQEYHSEKIRRRIPGMVTTEHNVFKRLCSELARVYKWGPTRELDTPEQTEVYRQLCDECRLDDRLARADYYLVGLRDIGLVPRVVDGRLWIDIWLPDRTAVVQHPDNPTEAVAARTQRTLSQTQGYGEILDIYGDAEKWVITNQYGKEMSRTEHGVGRLPVVWVHADEHVDTFWGDTAFEDVYDATLSVGSDIFKLGRMLQFQSELQPTYSGKPRDIAKGMTGGADSLWAGPGQWGVLNLQGNPEYLISTIKARIGWIAQQHGLAADVYDLSVNATSGFQIRLKRQPLEEARAARVKTWRRVEKELLTLIAIVTQREHPLLKLDPRAEFRSLNFHEEPMLEDPATQNAVWEKRINIGVMSEVDVAMELDPDLSREQAMEKILRTLEEREPLIEMKKRLGAPGVGGEQGKTQDENGRDGAAVRGRGKGDAKSAARDWLLRRAS